MIDLTSPDFYDELKKRIPMVHYPIHFEVFAKATDPVEEVWHSQEASLPQITCSIPPEFSGPGGGYTPQGLFGLAVLNCVISMIKHSAEKHKTHFAQIEGKLKATLDREPAFNHVLITHVEFFLKVTGAKDKELLQSIIKKAIEECPISNSIKSGKTYHIQMG